MKAYKGVCFDFDYTLGDSTASIIEGFRYGLTQMGWPEPDPEAVRGTIGYLLEDAYTMLTGDADPAHRAQFRPLFLSIAKPRQKEEPLSPRRAVHSSTAACTAGASRRASSAPKAETPSSISCTATACPTP